MTYRVFRPRGRVTVFARMQAPEPPVELLSTLYDRNPPQIVQVDVLGSLHGLCSLSHILVSYYQQEPCGDWRQWDHHERRLQQRICKRSPAFRSPTVRVLHTIGKHVVCITCI